MQLTDTEVEAALKMMKIRWQDAMLNMLMDKLRKSRSRQDIAKIVGWLPLELRHGLLRKLANERLECKISERRVFVAILVLLDCPIVSFDFGCCRVDSNGARPAFLKEVFDKLAKNSAYTLRTLQVDVESRQLRPCFDNLLRLAGLRSLSLPCCVLDVQDFDLLTSNLSQLASLECVLQVGFPLDGFVAGLTRLKRLDSFVFDVKCPTSNVHVSLDELCGVYSRLCVLMLPWLRVVGCAPTLACRRATKMCHVLHHDVASSLSTALSSRLEKLIVHSRMHPRQVEWHAACVRSLWVGSLRSDEDFEPLLKLQRVEQLFFGFSPSARMMATALVKFGPELRSLSFEVPQNVQLDQMLLLCPRIESLKTVDSLSYIPENLKELHWGFSDHHKFYPGLFRVLTAPNLEKVLICFLGARQHELSKVTGTLYSTNSPVAPRLKALQLTTQSLNVVNENRQALVDLVRAVCTKAPNLLEVKMPLPDLDAMFYYVNNRN